MFTRVSTLLLTAALLWAPAAVFAEPVVTFGKLKRFANVTADDTVTIDEQGLVPDMQLTFPTRSTALLVDFCGRFVGMRSGADVMRLRVFVDGELAEPTQNVVAATNFTQDLQFELSCFRWVVPAVERGEHTVEVHTNPSGAFQLNERSLTVLYR